MALNYCEQAKAIRAQAGMHEEYMLTNSMRRNHLQGSSVLLEGLQKQQQGVHGGGGF